MISSQMPEDAVPSVKKHILEGTCVTQDGTRLTPKEDKFISLYIQYSDPIKAAREAGYMVRPDRKNKDLAYAHKGKSLLAKDYIRNEIAARMDMIRDEQIADAKEVLVYLTKVMRGEIKDQFDIDASLSERTAAAKELNRRFKELEDAKEHGPAKEVHLVLRRE